MTLWMLATEVLAEALLLDEHVRGGDIAVDEAVGGVDVRLVLELYEALVGISDAEDAEKASSLSSGSSLLGIVGIFRIPPFQCDNHSEYRENFKSDLKISQ